jgi:hypothetical protein
MSNFVMLWNKTLDSSIWMESNETRILWFTMLMMKDKDGVVLASRIGLANRARLKPEECEVSLKVLTSPDKNDTSGVQGGERLKIIPGGWQIINHDAYKYADLEKRALWAEQKALQRARASIKKTAKKSKRGGPLPGEQEHEKALNNGASDEELGKIVERNLPATVAGNAVTNSIAITTAELAETIKAGKAYIESNPEPSESVLMCDVCGGCVPETGTVCNGCLDLGRGV